MIRLSLCRYNSKIPHLFLVPRIEERLDGTTDDVPLMTNVLANNDNTYPDDHAHPHDHPHTHDNAHAHDHAHPHSHDHTHLHTHENGVTHSHPHSHTHTHDHIHDHTHDHLHGDSHDHTHDHKQPKKVVIPIDVKAIVPDTQPVVEDIPEEPIDVSPVETVPVEAVEVIETVNDKPTQGTVNLYQLLIL